MDKTGYGEQAREKAGLRWLIPSLLYGFCGYLSGLCALPFGAHPFGVALLSSSGRSAPFVFAGLLISALQLFDGAAAAAFVGIYSAIFLLRVLLRLSVDYPYSRSEGKRSLGELAALLFSEKRGYRVSIAAFGAFFLSFSFLVGGGFLYYDLFGLLISVALAPSSAYLLCAYFDGEREGGADYRYEAGLLCLIAVSFYGAAPLNIYGASVAVAGGVMLTLLLCMRRGFIRGGLAAIVAGLAYSPTMMPIFVICALSAGVFMKISTTLTTVASLAASLAYAFYARGIYALEGVVGGIIAGALLFSVLAKLTLSGAKEAGGEQTSCARSVCRVLEESELDGVRLFEMNRRMEDMSEALSRLSDLFEEMELRFPRGEELRELCRRGFEYTCKGCSEYGVCHGSDRAPYDAERLVSALESKQFIAREDFPDRLSSRCGRLPDIIDEINYNFEVRARRSDGESRSVAEDADYRAFSRLLSREIGEDDGEYAVDSHGSARLCRSLQRLGGGIVGALVYGKRQKRIYVKGEDRDALERMSQEIKEAAEDALGISLDCSTLALRRCGGREEGSLELREAKRFCVLSATRRASKRGESYCGDCSVGFESKDGKHFSLISDGMGSGREAAVMSELTVGFMKNMLSVGGMSRELLQMLNSCLKRRCEKSSSECSATLDLLELDRMSGRAVFYKCGAAPTYVYRGGRLFKLRSRTMPLGILDDTDARVLDLELDSGDVVVMMSDGVTGGEEECPFLFDLLRQNVDSSDEQRIADLIMKYARSRSDDDVTVTVIKICEQVG